MEQFNLSENNPEQSSSSDRDLSFEKKEHKPGVLLYVFKNVVIGIDTTGKNYKELPELLFGTYDTEYGVDSMGQPEMKREGIDMDYVSKCIEKVSKESGIKEFWFSPYGEDKPEDKERREQARLRLFKRYADIISASSGFGYIWRVE